ncbi:MAG TPA: DUF2027 domain-containing protein [Cytophagaceae bacterium]|jgi:hypothetical protein
MQVGDKVRLVHSKGEGVIKNFLPNKQVEIEIEDGFIIPVLASEIVVVASEEKSKFTLEKKEPEFNTIPSTTTGVYLAFIPFNDKVHGLHLINNTDLKILYTFLEEQPGGIRGINADIIKTKSFVKLGEYKISEFEQWPALIIQILFFRAGAMVEKSSLEKRIKCKADAFYKNKKHAPLMNKEGFVFQLDKDNTVFKPEELQEKLMNSSSTPSNLNHSIQRPAPEVDLHIEKLLNDFSKLNNGEILTLQLKTFENSLSNALATGMEEIIFIHGTGNGILKTAIHKSLSQSKEIAYYNEARKEKFGYGATYVRLKF